MRIGDCAGDGGLAWWDGMVGLSGAIGNVEDEPAKVRLNRR